MAQEPRDLHQDWRAVALEGSRSQRGCVKVHLPSRRLVCLVGAAFVGMASFADRELVREEDLVRLASGDDEVETTSLAVSPTGSMIATTDTRGRVAIWDHAREWKIERFLDFPRFAAHVAFSPDGRLLAVEELGKGLFVWNLTSNQGLPIVPSALQGAKLLTFSPDGSRLAAVSNRNREIVIWGLAERRAISILRSRSPLMSLAFSADGRYLASGEKGDRSTVLLWDLDTGTQRLALVGSPGPVRSIAFSADGRLLATSAAYERGVRLWDLGSGRLKLMTAGHAQGTNAIAFSPDPDQSILASVGNDGMARLWAINTGEPCTVLDGRSARLSQVAFSPDGRFLFATGSNDNDIRFWKLSELDRSHGAQHANTSDGGQTLIVNNPTIANEHS
jgi:WD40 repeat protein